MSPAAFQLKFNKWDNELTELMTLSEDKCHKFMDRHIEFPPEIGT